MKQLFSILLSFILLSSHLYLTMGTHICAGEAVEIRIIFGETHLGCGMMDVKESCDDSEHSNQKQVRFDELPCCQNEFQTFQSTDEFVNNTTQTVFNFDFTVAFIYTSLNLDLFSDSKQQFYTEYISPPLEKDIQVLFQTFLI